MLLIRHAATHFNVEHQKVVKEFGVESEEFRAFKARRDLVDPPLSELGLAQCASGREHINRIDFKVVLVSPMLRTCMTTVELFREHPNKENIKFILYPLAKESAHLCNDFMKGPFKEQIYDQFCDPARCAGLKFDFQFMLGAFGCESTLQFNVIADLESLQIPYSFLDPEEMADGVGTMNQAVDRVLE